MLIQELCIMALQYGHQFRKLITLRLMEKWFGPETSCQSLMGLGDVSEHQRDKSETPQDKKKKNSEPTGTDCLIKAEKGLDNNFI